MTQIKLIVAGSRSFNDYQKLKSTLDQVLKHLDKTELEIVSGTAKGADTLGEKYAIANGFKIKRFPANWQQYGKKAGPLRNEKMAKYATHCVVFWDGVSRGTKSMINLAERHQLDLKVFLL